MIDHQYHRQLIWGWNSPTRSWDLLVDEVRPLYYESDEDLGIGWRNTEADQIREYEYNVGDATHGHVHVGHSATSWPGPFGNDHRRDAYFVGMMGWSPGMPSWEWQHYQNVWPQGGSQALSVQDKGEIKSSSVDLVAQGQGLPTPEDEESAARNKNIGVAVGVGLITTFSLWLILKVASHG